MHSKQSYSGFNDGDSKRLGGSISARNCKAIGRPAAEDIPSSIGWPFDLLGADAGMQVWARGSRFEILEGLGGVGLTALSVC